MKIMKRMMSLAAAILALSACSESDDILSSFHNDPNAVHITAEVGKTSADGFTRSNPLGDAQKQKQFNENDEISVKADGQEAVTYKFNGSEWIPQDSKFLKWESNEMNFTAYYPASYNGGTITQPTEYTDEKSLADADFMSFSDSRSKPQDNTLTLTMQRKMARVVVDVVTFNDQYAGATIDNINSLSICGVKAYKHNDNKFYALIKPCSNQDDQEFLSLNVGESNTETLKGIPALEAGKSYTYQLTVGKNKVIVTGITVADWTTSEPINGKAESYPYVTFTADGEQTFYLMEQDYFPSNIEYSVGTGDWKTLVADEGIPFGGDLGNLRLRATNNLNGTSAYTKDLINNHSYILFSKKGIKVACTGDIRTLLDYKNYKTVNTSNAQFFCLFSSCKELTSAPDLPATKLADYCYSSMFVGCTSLTKAPALPAQELAAGCYENMFNGCTNLSTVTMLASSDQITSKQSCCDSWLNNAGTDPTVTSRKLILKDVDAYYALVDKGYLPDKWKKGECNVLDGTPYVTFSAAEAQTFKLENNGYFPNNIEYSVGTDDWKPLVENEPIPFGGNLGNLQLRGTNSKGTAIDFGQYSTIKFTDDNVKVACTGDIRTLLDYRDFKNVTTSNARFCELFEHCKVLTSAPDLPAKTLAGSCYSYMFYKCSSLKVAPKLPATELAEKCYQGMFYECQSLQTAPTLPAETLATDCYNGMFAYCSSLQTAPTLPAETLASDCYNEMFAYCSSLKVAPKLPAKKMVMQCYTGMFADCSSLKVAPKLPATELAEKCYWAMFNNCVNLTTAPELPATTLEADCYDQMFNNCYKLSSITIMAPSTEISEKSFYNSNFNWIDKAGTDKSVTSRTLKVEDKAAYNALVAKGLEEKWQIGQCKVLDKDNNEIQK